jgi:Ca2+-binding EF-hand superfamily protein
MQAHFESLDVNGDRKITFLEFLSVFHQHSTVGEAFTNLDRDSNGVISQDEVKDINALPLIKFHF